MKIIKNGRLYNTDSAKKLGYYSYSNRGDFAFYEEALYLTKGNAYFIHGTGGAASHYAKPAGQNSWKGGEDIRPLSEDAAKLWAERHLSAEEYAYVFGEPPEA